MDDNVIAFRHYLHQNPELSFMEFGSGRYILSTLESHGIECRRVAGTGVLAIVHGNNPSPKSPVVLRADIDALPIDEANDLPYKSVNKGVMHACGHDMHAAVLMAVMIQLAENPDFEGTRWGLFQPGEESAPGGASLVISEGVFDGVTPKAVIGAHVSGELAVGSFGFRPGLYMAATNEIHITINGCGGHAAMKRDGGNAVVAMARLITDLQVVTTETENPMVLSIGKVEALGATNVVPSQVTLAGTMRTLDQQWRLEAMQRVGDIARNVEKICDVKIELVFGDGYPCVVNDFALTMFAKGVATKLFGKDSVADLDIKMTAEDFGYYTQLFPSLFYRFGVGEHCGAPHTPTFNPDEQALHGAVKFMLALATQA